VRVETKQVLRVLDQVKSETIEDASKAAAASAERISKDVSSKAGSQSGEFSSEEIDRMSAGETVKNSAGVCPTNCTEFPIETIKEYLKALGLEQLGDKVEKQARDSRGQGKSNPDVTEVESARLTYLVRLLKENAGFETTYIELNRSAPVNQNYASVNKEKVYPTRSDTIVGKDTGQGIPDVRAPVDVALRAKGNKKQREAARTFLEELSKTTFAIGTVDAGFHGFVIANGRVIEVHYREGHGSPELYESRSVEDFFSQYNDAIIAIPKTVPDAWLDKSIDEKTWKKLNSLFGN
jgi:hypothetical protein